MDQAHQDAARVIRDGRAKADIDRSIGGDSAASAQMPDFTGAVIDSNKITGYAMNPDHPVGRHKYRVINSATGLDTDDAALIERQLRDGVSTGTPIKGKGDEYGQRWAVDVTLTGPAGSIVVRSAWILDAGSTTPRLVTISLP